MRRGPRIPVLLLTCALALTGCAPADWDIDRAAPTAEGTPGPGFLPIAEPSPEATVSPTTGSWQSIHAPSGYRVVLLMAGQDETTQTLAGAVRDWAADEDVDLREIASEGDLIASIVEAMEMNPELIVSMGDELIEPLATVSAHHLDEQFLILGAEIPEPTENVTAVEWAGAGFRGDGIAAASEFDAGTFTPERGADAVRAGAASVLSGMTGVVLWID